MSIESSGSYAAAAAAAFAPDTNAHRLTLTSPAQNASDSRAAADAINRLLDSETDVTPALMLHINALVVMLHAGFEVKKSDDQW